MQIGQTNLYHNSMGGSESKTESEMDHLEQLKNYVPPVNIKSPENPQYKLVRRKKEYSFTPQRRIEGDDGELVDDLKVESGFRKVNSYAYNMKSNDLNDNDMQMDSY